MNLMWPWIGANSTEYKIYVSKNVKRDMTLASDFEGLLGRSPGHLGLIWEGLGGVAVFLPCSEMYEGLQKGMLDVSPSTLAGISSRKWYEVADKVVMVPVCVPNGLQMGHKPSWDALPDYLWPIWEEEKQVMYTEGIKMGFDMEAGYIALGEEKGMTFVYPAAEEVAKIQATGELAWQRWMEDSMSCEAGKEAVQFMKEMMDIRYELTGEHWVGESWDFFHYTSPYN
jgi:TRAP-type C4-dicarboxylate transport system substrate-binding protein